MESSADKKIYIPEQIKNVSVVWLPVSNNLAEFFKEYKIKVIGDLQETNVELLNKIVGSREKPFSELRHYILAFQESESNEITLISDAYVDNRQTQNFDEKRLKKHNGKIASILSQKIFIPLPAHKWRTAALPISQTLIKKIQMSGCGKLSDIHGIPYARFSSLRSFEDNDVIELYSFITQLQSVTEFRSVEAKVSAAETQAGAEEVRKITLPVVETAKQKPDIRLPEAKSFTQAKLENSNDSETIQTPTALKDLLVNNSAPSNESNGLPKKNKIFHFGQLPTQKFAIPERLKQLQINRFTISIKLANILNELGIKVAGDIEKISYEDFKKTPLHTKQEETEFWQLISQIENSDAQAVESSTQQSYFQLEALDLAGLMDFINRFLPKLPPIEKEILIDRFGGASNEQVLKFETIANKNQTSRERVYQIYVKTFGRLKEKIQHRAENTLEKLNDDCVSLVCPLTPKFLIHLINDKFELFQYPPAFYIRMFGALLPKLPVLPEIKNQIVALSADAKKIEREIKSILENSPLPVSLPEIFNRVIIYISNKETAEGDFFEAVQSAKFNLIETDKPNELFIEQREMK